MFCCTLLYVHSSIALILMRKRELIALLSLSSWCLVIVERLFLAVPQGCLQFVIVVFTDHTHYFLLYVCPYSHQSPATKGIISITVLILAVALPIRVFFSLFCPYASQSHTKKVGFLYFYPHS